MKSAVAALACGRRDGIGGPGSVLPGTQARAALESDLREAVRTEAFELAYQPQYAAASDRLIGFEALLRWRHPARGLVGPGEFISIAEDIGLIVPIGAWVLRQACAEAARWPDRLTVAVNMSAVQCNSTAIVQTVRAALGASGLQAARLDLEVTETAALFGDGGTLAVLHALQALGVSLSMDDFGTGYSSLSYLCRFPFDRIKIDQSFVRDLARRHDARAIVRSILGLGRELGIKVLAEGVETPDQLAFLRQAGCEEVQGYLLGRPVPAEAARLLARRPSSAAPVPPAVGTGVPLRVLLVDDVLMNRDIAGSVLRSAGHSVVVAEGGAEAVEAARGADFDIVLMDVRMPEMDGLEATRRLRAIRGWRGRVPVVAVTALAFPEQVTECRLAGMTGHLAKPYTPEALLATVANLGSAWADTGAAEAVPARPAREAGLPVIDQAAFERTISFLRPATAAVHLQIIAERAGVLLDRLRDGAIAAHPQGELTEAAHMLAGSAGLFGFGRLASVAREFRHAERTTSPEAPDAARKLTAELEASLREIRHRASVMSEA